MKRLTAAEIRLALPRVKSWRKTGKELSRTFPWNDFLQAMRFVNQVARYAEKAQHHPDIDIRWNEVTLALTTHDVGGLTEKDFLLAEKFDLLAKKLK